jgi:hypothetical protein
MISQETFEKLIADMPPEARAKAVLLWNAHAKTVQAYQQTPTEANRKNWEGSEKALSEFLSRVESADDEKPLAAIADVLEYLKAGGWMITRTTLYRHQGEGKLALRGGAYRIRDVDRYARTWLKQSTTGKRLREQSEEMQRRILMQQSQINDLKIRQQERRDAIEEKKYVAVQVVLDAAFTMFRHTRDAMQNIPDRIGEIVAAETDPAKVREILTAEIRQALERLEKPEAIIEI